MRSVVARETRSDLQNAANLRSNPPFRVFPRFPWTISSIAIFVRRPTPRPPGPPVREGRKVVKASLSSLSPGCAPSRIASSVAAASSVPAWSVPRVRRCASRQALTNPRLRRSGPGNEGARRGRWPSSVFWDGPVRRPGVAPRDIDGRATGLIDLAQVPECRPGFQA